MNLKDKTREELEAIIANEGIGSDQLKKAQRIQRDVNLALIFGALTTVGLTAWAVYRNWGK